MAAKAKATKRAGAPTVTGKTPPGSSSAPALTLEERLHRIEAMGKRMESYIQFMCKIGSMNGTSSEVKERAVAVFYQQMVLVESQLAHIYNEFRLE